MNLIVQKYGGSSLADASRIQNVARIITKASKEGKMVVAVVTKCSDKSMQKII